MLVQEENMNKLEDIKLTVSNRFLNPNGRYYEELFEREKYLNEEVNAERRQILHREQNVVSVNFRVYFEGYETTVEAFTMYKIEDTTTRRMVFENIIRALEKNYKSSKIEEIEIYMFDCGHLEGEPKNIIDIFENRDAEDEKYIVIKNK